MGRTGHPPTPGQQAGAAGYWASRRSSTAGSAPATSTILRRLAAPATSVTAWRRTPNAAATAASAAAVARPSTARSLTRTTSAPSYSPPTPGLADPGRTQTAMRTAPVCPVPPPWAWGAERLPRSVPWVRRPVLAERGDQVAGAFLGEEQLA